MCCSRIPPTPIKKNILSLDEEIRAITKRIRMSEHRDSLDLIPVLEACPDDLLQALNQHKPHIVHFSGHGAPEGQIFLDDNDGNPTPVNADTLQRLFSSLKDNIRLVVLNACYSKAQAKAIAKAIDCAIGMNAPVNDDSAIAFAGALYGAIGFGRSIEQAFEQGKLAVSLNNLEGENTPELIRGRGVDPAQIILVSEPEAHDLKSPSGLPQDPPPRAPNNAAPQSPSANEKTDPATIGGANTLVFASTFLSHSSADAPLVEAVARELGRRGILVWLDKNELYAGSSLSGVITRAVKDHATFTAFLSPDAIKSDCVDHELKAAFEKEDELNAKDLVLPVFLGDPEVLVRDHPLLRKRWCHGTAKLADRAGVIAENTGGLSVQARKIASEVAAAIYRKLKIEAATDVVIYLDQRGNGARLGKPKMPDSLANLNAPVLVFRPDPGLRSDGETLHGAEWEEMRDTMKSALADALQDIRSQHLRKIHLAGHAQLGFSYLIARAGMNLS